MRNVPPRNDLPADVIARVLELKQDGMSNAAVARAMDRSHGSINGIWYRHGNISAKELKKLRERRKALDHLK